MIGGRMPLSVDFLTSRQVHRHCFLMLQALRHDQLSKLLEEIRDFEQVIHPSQVKTAKAKELADNSDQDEEIELKMNSMGAQG